MIFPKESSTYLTALSSVHDLQALPLYYRAIRSPWHKFGNCCLPTEDRSNQARHATESSPEAEEGVFSSYQSPSWRLSGLMLALVLVLSFLSAVTAAGKEPVTVGFSATFVGNKNEQDTLAAVRAWADALFKDEKVNLSPKADIYKDAAALEKALIDKKVDAVNMAIVEFVSLRKYLDTSLIVAGNKGNTIFEEFVLLVHRQSGINQLADLKGRSLVLLDNERTALAPIWLDTVFAKQTSRSATQFAGKLLKKKKVNETLLPVFFRKIDACVITRDSFATMVELNPQLGQQLKELAASPPIVPILFCFRQGIEDWKKQQLLELIVNWHTTPQGQQILAIFQTESLVEQPLNVLDSGLRLIDQHRHLFGNGGAVRAISVVKPSKDST